MGLMELARRYEEARSGKEAAEAALKDANAALESASTALSDAMVEEEMSSFKSEDGTGYSLAVKDYYRAEAGRQDELMDALRENGLGDIVRETVNANTLSATMRELAERNDGQVPPEYDGLLSVYSKTTISRRRG